MFEVEKVGGGDHNLQIELAFYIARKGRMGVVRIRYWQTPIELRMWSNVGCSDKSTLRFHEYLQDVSHGMT
jgi:hypothetical protein